jgi:hypothetical protein
VFGFREVTGRWPALIGLKWVVNPIEIEPQNTEQGIMNVEVLKFIILNSLFDSAELVAGDIRYSKKTAVLRKRVT